MAIISIPAREELPKKKMNSPLGRFVCWNCKATMPLIKVDKGYVCINCKHLGSPSGNKSSYIEFKYKDE